MKNPNAIYVCGKLMGVAKSEFQSGSDFITYHRVVVTHENKDDFGRSEFTDIQIAMPNARAEEIKEACSKLQEQQVIFECKSDTDSKGKWRLGVPDVLNIQKQALQTTANPSSTATK